ncbi:hypothetical protein [Halobacterium sp. R2-5]|uniref:DUF7261 family protein n=1 Tax=Halobacterium sp. R2-5 TaxID=2715751 RepID=UPI0014202648|nr:hypothetical protein [Halobacterium sp. R2-5]NIB99154.1 hypothetical protein [Halobacterium sp. R2-5]
MDDRRGQLLLVAGLGLALAFVVLALVLNAVVFTENLATRNHAETDDVVGHERAVEAGVGGLLAETNAYNDSDDASLESALNASVATWDANASLLAASGGTVTHAEVVSTEPGTRIAQSDERNFSNASGVGDWTAAADVEETRRFEMVVTPTSSDPLTVNVSDGATEWRVEIADAGSDTVVEVRNETSPLASETVASDTVAVDVTEGTVNGTRVPGWTFAENVSAGYDVRIENGGEAGGKYGFIVKNASVDGDDYEAPENGSPTTAPALYRANVSVAVQNDRVTYETNVSVAPEGSPAAAPWTSPAE